MRNIPIFFSNDYVLSAYAFDTTRKSKRIADSLAAHPIAGIKLKIPMPLTEEHLETVHDSNYVAAVCTGIPRELAESQGFPWDKGLFRMVLSSNGGAVAAALAALQEGKEGTAGSLSSGLHHARRGRGAGFCTFNGLVLAAQAALYAGANSVLILDLDAHCGGGTYSLIHQEPGIWQIDIATNSFDQYTPTSQTTLDVLHSAVEYIPTLTRRLEEITKRGVKFDLCLYNAGMDPFEHCAEGGLTGVTSELLAQRENVVFTWSRSQGIPIAFVIAGGYRGPKLSSSELVGLHRLTFEAAAR